MLMQTLIGAILVLMVALTLGCSGSSDKPPTVTIEVTANQLRFVPDVITVPAGQVVKLQLKNLDQAEHDLEVRDLMPSYMSGGGHGGHGGGDGPERIAVHTKAGKTASVEFQADQKGTYGVFCTIPGHEQLGMVARLIVE